MDIELSAFISDKLDEYGLTTLKDRETICLALSKLLQDAADFQSAQRVYAARVIHSDLRSILRTQNDFAFQISETNHVLWFHVSADSQSLFPGSQADGGPLDHYFAEPARKQITSELQNRGSQGEASFELDLGHGMTQPGGEPSSVFTCSLLHTDEFGTLLLGQRQQAATQETQHYLHSIEQLESFNAILVSLQRTLNLAGNLRELQSPIVHAAKTALGAEMGSLWLFEEERRALVPEVVYHGPRNQRVHQGLLHRANAERYFEQLGRGRVTAIHNRASVAHSLHVEHDAVFYRQAQSILEAPIRFEGEVIGVIRVENTFARGLWNSNEQTFIASLADIYSQYVEKIEKEMTLAALNESEQRFKTLTENSDAAIFAFDDTFLYTNPALEALVGMNSEALLETPVAAVFGRHFEFNHRLAAQHERTPDAQGISEKSEVEIFTEDGESRWLYITATRSRYSGVPCWLASAFDITERKTSEARLKYQAYHDQLTGLPNRARFADRIEASLSRSSRDQYHRCAVLMINIDRFKVFNDSLGQLFGDQLLLEMSKRLRKSLDTTNMAARISGDEFAVFLDDIREQHEVSVAIKEIQSCIEAPLVMDNHETVCSTSIGAVIAGMHYEKAEHVLRDAGIAMYHAKREVHSSHVFFDRSMHERAQQVLEIETELRLAIRRQTLELYYQPIIDLKTGLPVYFEALIRWRKSPSILVSPADFIPLAEESGVILSLGNWVVDQACERLAAWNELGYGHVGLSINVSGKQFEKAQIADEIADALARHAVAQNRLKVEMTETSMIENSINIREQLQKLRDCGCELLVDDFGTGYSSLSYLHQFPIDCIKIDRSFIANINCEEDSIEIVRAITHLAHNLNLTVVAEGVETESQLEALQTLGCDFAQGYYFAPPLSKEEAEKLLLEPASRQLKNRRVSNHSGPF